MKYVFLLILVAGSFLSKAQVNNKTTGSNCTCLPGNSICSADATFMSCCICCQAGSSCGSWTAFGFCACKCENTGTGSGSTTSSTIRNIRFYGGKYSEFINYLDLNKVPTSKLKELAKNVTEGKMLNKSNVENGKDFYILSDDDNPFIDAYVAEMKILTKNATYASLVEAFLKSNK
ncbi:MAG TPA: hypothetical protein PLC48_01495 [Ferruginibacter sp.]|nr:hypothetical protein [Ferruginibacter sp.]